MFGEDTHVATNRGCLSEDHIAFVDGVPERWEPFDFASVERALGELPKDRPDAAALELGDLLRWVWEKPGNISAARQRFKALSREVSSHPGRNRASVAFRKLVTWCEGRIHRYPESPFRSFCAVSATVDPRLVAAKTYVDLARELGVTKAAVSAAARHFRRHFSFYFHEYRPATGREHMRQARLAQRLPGAPKAINRNVRNLPASGRDQAAN
jgi:hypothetical protein